MRPATHTVTKKPIINKNIDNANCQSGTPDCMRIIIAMGDVKGMIDNQTDSVLSGLLIITDCASIKVNMSGSVTGNINCWVSVSLSTAEPTAANKALYSKKPNRK